MMQPITFAALETNGNFYIDCNFFAQSNGQSFPLFVREIKSGFEVYDNGFLLRNYGLDAQSVAGIQMVANAFGFNINNGIVTATAKTEQQQTELFGKLLSACYCIDSTLGTNDASRNDNYINNMSGNENVGSKSTIQAFVNNLTMQTGVLSKPMPQLGDARIAIVPCKRLSGKPFPLYVVQQGKQFVATDMGSVYSEITALPNTQAKQMLQLAQNKLVQHEMMLDNGNILHTLPTKNLATCINQMLAFQTVVYFALEAALDQ